MSMAAGLRWLVLALLICLGSNNGVTAADNVLDVGHGGESPVSLTAYLAVLEDPDAILTLADVQRPAIAERFKQDHGPGSDLNFGFTRSAYWLRLTLRNSGDHPLERLLEVSNWGPEKVEFHSPMETGAYRSVITGSVRPFATRPYPTRNFVFPITLQPRTDQVVYLRFQSTSLAIPAQLWEPNAFHLYERTDYVGQALYFGLAFGMILFNLLLFIALRDTIYLQYVGFVALVTLTICEFSGLGKQLLWPDSPYWTHIATNVLSSLSLVMFLVFMRRMLDTPRVIPKFDLVLKTILGIHLLSPLVFAIALDDVIQWATLGYGITAILIFGTSIFLAFKRHRSAYFFLAAFVIMVLGALLIVLRVLGLLPTNMLTVNGFQVGSAMEMVLLAFALGDRYNQLRQEKAEARQEALRAQNDALLAQTQLAQSEKMAALGVLIAGVTHEINTPIGAIKSSGASIAEALDQTLANLPPLFKALDAEALALFLRLIRQAHEVKAPLGTREARAVTADVTRTLEAAGIEAARSKAGLLVKLNGQSTVGDYLPLLRHPDSALILETAGTLDTIIRGAGNINVAVDRVAKLVLALKSFSRVNREPEMTEASLQDGVETVLTIYHHQLKLDIEVVRQYEAIPPIRCLPDELNQVWTNLIHNALQAMEHKGTLSVSIRRVGDEAVVSVGDTGCGIPEEIRGKIFDVFFTTKPAGVGSGLGLDIVRKIVDKHRGRIEVESQAGVGTTFSVYLPYVVQATGDA